MIEYAEDFQDGFIYANKPAAPGQHIIFEGDDVTPGKCVLPAGRKLCAPDIGTLAALGYSSVPVRKKPIVGILSTGDEIIGIDEKPVSYTHLDVYKRQLLPSLQGHLAPQLESRGDAPSLVVQIPRVKPSFTLLFRAFVRAE